MPQINVAILSSTGNLSNFHWNGSLTSFQPSWTMQVPKSTKTIHGTLGYQYGSYVAFVDKTNIFIGNCDGEKLMSFFKAKKIHRTIPKSKVPRIPGSFPTFQGRIGAYFVLIGKMQNAWQIENLAKSFLWSTKKLKWFKGPKFPPNIEVRSNVCGFDREKGYFLALDIFSYLDEQVQYYVGEFNIKSNNLTYQEKAPSKIKQSDRFLCSSILDKKGAQ
jgi:hypothetical protein